MSLQVYELEQILNADKLTILFPRSSLRAEFQGPTAMKDAIRKYGKAEVRAISADGIREGDALAITCGFAGEENAAKGDLSAVAMDESIFAPKTKYRYLLNISHPKVEKAFAKFKESRGIGHSTPLSDAERFEFEALYFSSCLKKAVVLQNAAPAARG